MARERRPEGVALGAVIRERRQELGLSQEEYAARVGDGITQGDVSHLERGLIGRPRTLRMVLLADALGWSAAELMERAGWVRSGGSAEGSHLLRASGLELARIELMERVQAASAEDVRTLLLVAQRLPSGRKPHRAGPRTRGNQPDGR